MDDQQDKFDSQVKKYRLIAVGVIVAALAGLALFAGLSSSGSDSTGYSLENMEFEQLAVANARLAITESAIDGSGTLAAMDCGLLRNVAKATDGDNRWFADCSFISSGSVADTEDEKVLKLSDGDYCATFKLNNDLSELDDYSFTDEACGDVSITVL